MKKLMNRPRILIGIFMAPLSLSLALSLIVNTSASAQTTPSADPALAKDPATAALEALAPAGANASAPVAAQPATVASAPMVQAPAAAPVKIISPSEVADARRAKANSFAFASLPEVTADANGDGHPSDSWIADKSNDKSVAIFNYKGGSAMRFQQLALTATSGAVVTVDMIDKKSTLTVFEKKKPVSYTVIRSGEHYTATPSFCKILKEQTKSSSFQDLAEKAKTCNAFYDRGRVNASDDKVAGAIVATHLSNLQLMKTTIAKDFVPDRTVPNVVGKVANWADRQNDAITNYFRPGKLNSRPPVNSDTWKARPVLSKTSSKDDMADRQIIEEVSGACATLWTDADAEPTRAKGSSPVKAGKIAK